ncbi:MAG: hypothetical protein RR161_01715, partial [Bacilli bacterium]
VKYHINVAYFKDKSYNVSMLNKLERMVGIIGSNSFKEIDELSLGDGVMEDTVSFMKGITSEEWAQGIYNGEELQKAINEELREKAWYEGKEEGITEGEQLGLQKGEQLGLQKGIITTAKEMLKEKIDLNVISKVTKIPIDELKKLKY